VSRCAWHCLHLACKAIDSCACIQRFEDSLLVRSCAAEKAHSFDLAVAYRRAQQKLLLVDLRGQPIPVFLTPGKCM
jgi:hypothetical protein